jgi:hypothetical protein
MRKIAIAIAIAATLSLPSAAGAARTGWKQPLSRTGDSAARLSGQLALLARARAGGTVAEVPPAVPELPRTGGAPGLIALAGLGLCLSGAGLRRLRPPC